MKLIQSLVIPVSVLLIYAQGGAAATGARDEMIKQARIYADKDVDRCLNCETMGNATSKSQWHDKAVKKSLDQRRGFTSIVGETGRVLLKNVKRKFPNDANAYKMENRFLDDWEQLAKNGKPAPPLPGDGSRNATKTHIKWPL